jgi:hypothetical protein
MTIRTKSCLDCGKQLPLKDFYINSFNSDGRSSYCIACDKKRSHDNYVKNKPDRLLTKKKWQAENYDKHLEINRRYQAANKGQLSETVVNNFFTAMSLAKHDYDAFVKVGQLDLFVQYRPTLGYEFSSGTEIGIAGISNAGELLILVSENKYNRRYLNRIKTFFHKFFKNVSGF